MDTLYQTNDGRIILPAVRLWTNFQNLYQRVRGENLSSAHEKHSDSIINHDQEILGEARRLYLEGRRGMKFAAQPVEFIPEDDPQIAMYYMRDKALPFFEDEGKKIYVRMTSAKSSDSWSWKISDLDIITGKE